MTPTMLFALICGLGLMAGYVWLGAFCAKQAWLLSAGLRKHWPRVMLVSAVVVFFFMPGLVGGGHGVGVGPAWMMFATGTFGALTTASKLQVLLSVCFAWGVAFAAVLFVTRAKKPQ